MNKVINDPDGIVDEMLDGYVAAYGDYVKRAVENPRVIVRASPKQRGKVGLVIGNGSGHEPIAMGWVGHGMLDANAVGDVFTAPSPDAIVDAIRAGDHGAGVLLLVSQHAGDIINAELAVELALEEGLAVEPVFMYDDIASAPKGHETERRGGPGTMFIYKIVGAHAEEGATLQELKRLGNRTRDATRSLSAAVKAGTSPVTGQPTFALPEGEVFLGMGVHGEAGFRRMRSANADAIVDAMLEGILEDLPFGDGDTVLSFVNGSGGTTLMELFIVERRLEQVLRSRGIRSHRPLVGEYVTTQEMAGFSISLCRADAELVRLWDAPSQVPFFHR